MSFETWVSILLAALAVLLAIVTLIVAIAGIAIALVSIWGLKGLRIAAEKKADEAVSKKVAEYPEAHKFIELYEDVSKKLGALRTELETWQQRSASAEAIMLRLTSKESDQGLGKSAEGSSLPTQPEPISESYPGEEVNSNASNDGSAADDKRD